jgi:transcriptional regulator with XRE-family HTH domain
MTKALTIREEGADMPTRRYSSTSKALIRAMDPTTADKIDNIEALLDFPIERQRALTNLLTSQRNSMGKTQSQIAVDAGVDQTTISTIERKISLRMGWVTFVKIMNAYGLSLDYVMQVLGLTPEEEELDNPRILAIVEGLKDLDDDWQDYALSNIEVWLMGLRQRIGMAAKHKQKRATTPSGEYREM